MNDDDRSGSDPEPSLNFADRAIKAWERARHSEDRADLDEAVHLLKSERETLAADRPVYVTVLGHLRSALEARFNLMGEIQDLNEAIDVGREIMRAADQREPFELSYIYNNLAAALELRYELADGMDDLEEAVVMRQKAVSCFIQWGRFPLLHDVMSVQSVLQLRYERTGHLADLAEAISLARQAFNFAGADNPHGHLYLSCVESALRYRFERTGEIRDLDEMVDSYYQILDPASIAPRERDLYLSKLGAALRYRFEHTGQMDDLNKEVDAARQTIDSVSVGHHKLPAYLSNLSDALGYRFLQHGDRTHDLDEAVDLARRASELAREAVESDSWLRLYLDDPERCFAPYMYLSKLSVALRDRFLLTGGQETLDEAVDVAREAAISIPDSDPRRRDCLSNLRAVLQARYKYFGQVDDLEAAIDAAKQVVRIDRAAVDSGPERGPQHSQHVSRLMASLSRQFDCTDRQEDLDEAIAWARRALGSEPGDHQGWTMLGELLKKKALRTYGQEDLDEAANSLDKAINATPVGHPIRPHYLSVLASLLLYRFDWTGAVRDLDEAIDIARQAVNTASPGNVDLPVCMAILGNALQYRYGRTRQRDDLDEAIDVARKALHSIHATHPNLPDNLSNLANALQMLYRHTNRPENLDEAVTLLERSLSLIPNSHPERLWYLFSLGGALLVRFEHIRRDSDLEQAVKFRRMALDSAQQDDPALSAYLAGLGDALLSRYRQTSRLKDLHEATALFRRASGMETAGAKTRFNSAKAWGQASSLCGQWDDAMEGYGAALDLAELLVSHELGRSEQADRLRLIGTVARDGVAACLEANQPERAVEMFEQGRAVLFSQMLDARSDKSDLEQTHPELAQRFRRWRDALDGSEVHAAGLSLHDDMAREILRTEAERRRRAAIEFRKVLTEIRSHPGFERFLRPPRVADLLPVAAEGPIVLLNVAHRRSDALILTAGNVEVVPLKGVDIEGVEDKIDRFTLYLTWIGEKPELVLPGAEAQLGAVLTWLGDRVTSPVLSHLGYNSIPEPGMGWPRIWWCPSGVLSVVPLHACGRHKLSDAVSDAVIDRVISSTIPNIRALLRARQAPQSAEEQKMLVVAMPHTPGQIELPGAKKEAHIICNLYQAGTTTLGLPNGDPANFETVIRALPEHARVHFSCHGQSDQTDPSLSSLLLTDYGSRPLTVREIMRAHVDAELAFLSACTTAKADHALPDEPSHLTAACQLAGYRNVVGSLWPIDDRASTSLTKRFYTDYVGMTGIPGAAAIALHHATRNLRLVYRNRPSRWAPYIHSGS